MKKAPLSIGIILLLAGLIGIVFSQLSVFWVWFLVILGTGVIIWTVITSKQDNDLKKR